MQCNRVGYRIVKSMIEDRIDCNETDILLLNSTNDGIDCNETDILLLN